MGAFYTNINIKSKDASIVNEVLKGYTYIQADSGEWQTLYIKETEDQNIVLLMQLTAELSLKLKCPTIAFMMHDSDVLYYFYYNAGKALDTYNSNPDYFEEADPESKEREKGKADLLAAIALPGVTKDDIEKTLTNSTDAEETLQNLTNFLGIAHANTGYTYVKNEGVTY